MDRKLRQIGIEPGQLTPLDRLAWVGAHGMGALAYHPEHPALPGHTPGDIDLDRLAGQSLLVLKDSPRALLDELLSVGGSPQGARPKALIGVSGDRNSMTHGVDDLLEDHAHWIIKFRADTDPLDSGAIEHAYAEMARQAGIAMPATALFPAKTGPGYFGIQRFDRIGNRRVHLQTISGLLNIDHTLPSLGYGGLLKAARQLTRCQGDVEQIFLRMVFNVMARNRDDHTKNHSFLMNAKGEWSVSPAYDLTLSSGPGGEHALDVAGEGRNPGVKHIQAVAVDAGVGQRLAGATIERVTAAIDHWPAFASESGVSKRMTSHVDRILNGPRRGKRRPKSSHAKSPNPP